ncbi:MAG: hypothetical protein U9P68_11395 [Pseudomonadota bacterium]|nr:hypothetical protein [Pseudomonadota bacterium]
MVETAFIHIGTEKTGTTTIQDFLYRNASALEAAGHAVLSNMGGRNHTRLAAYAMADTGPANSLHLRYRIDGPQARAAFDAGVEADLAKAVEAAPSARHLLASSEHLQSRLRTTDELEKLKALFARHVKTCKIVVYLRRQDEMAVSLYSTRLKAGNVAKSTLFPAEGSLPFMYDYAALMDRLVAVFGEENVIVRLFDRGQLVEGDLIADYADAIGLDGVADLERPDARNPSLSNLGIRFLEAFNEHVPDRVDGQFNRERRNLVPIMEEHFAGRSALVARAEAEAFYDRFCEGNATIRARFFPELDRETLFSEDFSAYPETADAGEYGFDDAVGVAAKLWVGASREVLRVQAENQFLRGQLLVMRSDFDGAITHFQRAVDTLNTAPERYVRALETSRRRAGAAAAAGDTNSMVEAEGPRNK